MEEKWYKLMNADRCYRKGYIDDDGVEYSERIEYGKWREYSNYCVGLNRLQEVSIEEVRPFLPSNHPDLNLEPVYQAF